ncbi:MAG: TonB C-terminal domain-containing protein [Candidatus Obscuribacterales bacterium]|nr:TonB C-terminal domain-containing protein [Candidatus Obscuribacterales bacterium]
MGNGSKIISTMLIAAVLVSTPSMVSANSLKKLLQPVTKAAQPEKPDIRDKWAILVGVNRFTDQSIPGLKFAQKSSADLARALKDPDSGHFGLDHVLVVNGPEASKEGIDRYLNEWLYKKALPSDLVVIYFNSRLAKGPNGEVIVCANNTMLDDPANTGINLIELLKSAKQRIGSQNILVMLDLSPTKEGIKTVEGQDLKSIATATGVTIFSGAELYKPVFDDQQSMQSRFAHFLVEAIKSGGATFPIAMVAEYVWQKVQQETQATPTQAQTPILALASEQSQTTTIPLGIMVKSSLPQQSISVGHKLDDLAMNRPDIIPPKATTIAGPATPTIGVKMQSRNPAGTSSAAKPASATGAGANATDKNKIAAVPPAAAKTAATGKTAAPAKPAEEEEDDSFDPNLDFGPYMTKMKQDIQKKWQMPKGLESRRVTTVFSIMRDGKIANISITEGSGNEAVDKSALAALDAASPLDPLPKGAPPSVDIKYVFDWKTRQGN